jgi:hypothetical protein
LGAADSLGAAVAGGLIGELGAVGACAKAPDNISADSAVPNINVFIMIASLELIVCRNFGGAELPRFGATQGLPRRSANFP